MNTIASGNAVAAVAVLIGDPARANILLALMGGQALTATELAGHAGVMPQTASGHLAKLTDAGVLSVEKQGRHRYFRIASAKVAKALEALMVVAADGPKRHRPPGPKDAALRLARTCYDHIAGRLGVALADALAVHGHVVSGEGAVGVTATGQALLHGFGVDLAASGRSRPLCRTCLDWSERRPHLAGRLGAALLIRADDLGWIARVPGSRALALTAAGRRGFVETFGLPPDWAERGA